MVHGWKKKTLVRYKVNAAALVVGVEVRLRDAITPGFSPGRAFFSSSSMNDRPPTIL
jgi:hypothetical protein